MKKLLVISILVLVVGCSGKSTSSTKSPSKDKFPLSCGRDNPKGVGHSTYGIPQLWSC